MLKLWKLYQGCFYPVFATTALLAVLMFLAAIIGVDDVILPKPVFTSLPDYPDGISLKETTLITQTGMKWLMLSYFYWLIGLVTIGFSLIQLYQAAENLSAGHRRILCALFFSALLITILSLVYIVVVEGTALMSFEFILENLTMIGRGLVNLATCNTGLGYVAIVAIIVAISLLLAPHSHDTEKNQHFDNTQRMRTITRIMYCGAAFLLVWVAQATEMYRLAATLLIEGEREAVLDFAPTISLVVGVFASMLLAAAYMSAYVWLQSTFKQNQSAVGSAQSTPTDSSPKGFVLSHWPKIIAVLMPLLPGVIGSVANGVGHAI